MQLNPTLRISPADDPDYPSSDGKPMADNTTQFDWIVALQSAINFLFRDQPDVVVAGDCLWYPVEGDNTIRVAPDTMVIFGRPKGHRGSYIQHREAGVPVQVAFEVLSPGNRAGEMRRKLEFYERYGVEEYYVLDPDRARHKGYLRTATGKLEPVAEMFSWTSLRLGIRFEMTRAMRGEFRIIGPDGRPLEFVVEVFGQRDAETRRADEAQLQRDAETRRADEAQLQREVATRRADEAQLQRDAETRRADRDRLRATKADRRADEATIQAEQEKLRADEAQRERDAEKRRADRLLERLRVLGIDPDA